MCEHSSDHHFESGHLILPVGGPKLPIDGQQTSPGLWTPEIPACGQWTSFEIHHCSSPRGFARPCPKYEQPEGGSRGQVGHGGNGAITLTISLAKEASARCEYPGDGKVELSTTDRRIVAHGGAVLLRATA
jgi:hypothetical protein